MRTLFTPVLVMLACCFALSSCTRKEPAAVREYEAKEAIGQVRNDFAVLVDVRAPADFDSGHASGAKSQPLAAMEKEADWRNQLPRDKTIIFYGHSEEQGMRAAGMAAAEGFNAGYLKSFAEWKTAQGGNS